MDAVFVHPFLLSGRVGVLKGFLNLLCEARRDKGDGSQLGDAGPQGSGGRTEAL
jgi:hypothetical protein